MPTKGVRDLVWDMFENTGDPTLFVLFRSLYRKSRKEREREEIERLTR